MSRVEYDSKGRLIIDGLWRPIDSWMECCNAPTGSEHRSSCPIVLKHKKEGCKNLENGDCLCFAGSG